MTTNILWTKFKIYDNDQLLSSWFGGLFGNTDLLMRRMGFRTDNILLNRGPLSVFL